MLRIHALGKAQPHRQTLHNFDVVSGRIFRRQKGELIAAGAGHTLDVTVVFSVGGINVNRRPSPRWMSRNWFSLKFAVTQISSS